ncbi:MAG: hypothetical protein JSW61_00310, partial [Candidatus Thorarchaeota archaeon]
ATREIVVQVSEPASLTSNIVITVQSPTHYQRLTTTGSGEVVFDLPDLVEAENMTITLSGDGCIPLQVETEIPAGSRNIDYVLILGPIVIAALVVVIVTWYRLRVAGK